MSLPDILWKLLLNTFIRGNAPIVAHQISDYVNGALTYNSDNDFPGDGGRFMDNLYLTYQQDKNDIVFRGGTASD
jgi:hypothetical protein